MSVSRLPVLSLLSAALLAASPLASATNGYFAHGYGVKSLGMAGVAYALPQDSLVAASNPAGLTAIGNRLDLGVTWFKPERGAEYHGNDLGYGYSIDGKYDGNDPESFLLPEFGYSRQFNEQLTFGLAIYGNGGMNTDYDHNPFAMYGSKGELGVDLAQIFVTPSLAWQINEQHSLGIGINYAWQRFKAKGLSAFESMSIDPAHVSNQGYDHGDGWGVRLGWLGQITEQLSIGASWSSKIRMDKFDQYRGLFADYGSFDIPENYGIGLAFKATPKLTLAFDLQEIRYDKVRAISSPVSLLFAGNPLGSEHGPNFGWEDIRVYKLGASYEVDKQLTLRAGYSKADQALDKGETFFNTVAPGVIREHLTFGASWTLDSGNEISLFYAHAFKEKLKGNNAIPSAFGGGEVDLEMQQDSLGIAFGWKI